jgi:hypothetical protein
MTLEPPSHRWNRENREIEEVALPLVARRRARLKAYRVAAGVTQTGLFLASVYYATWLHWVLLLLGVWTMTLVGGYTFAWLTFRLAELEHRSDWLLHRWAWLGGRSAVLPEEIGQDGLSKIEIAAVKHHAWLYAGIYATATTLFAACLRAGQTLAAGPDPRYAITAGLGLLAAGMITFVLAQTWAYKLLRHEIRHHIEKVRSAST